MTLEPGPPPAEPGPPPAEPGAAPGDAGRPGPPALPDALPVLPLRGAVVLPFAVVPLGGRPGRARSGSSTT